MTQWTVLTRLWLRRLQWTTDKELEEVLGASGRIKQIKFFEDRVNGKSKGYAFVEFASAQAAAAAKQRCSGKELHGRALLVNFVSPKTLRQLQQPGSMQGPPPMMAAPGALSGPPRPRGGGGMHPGAGMHGAMHPHPHPHPHAHPHLQPPPHLAGMLGQRPPFMPRGGGPPGLLRPPPRPPGPRMCPSFPFPCAVVD